MTTPALDYTLARNLMVDGQLRPTKVNDRRLARHHAAPAARACSCRPALRDFAYLDEDLKLSATRVHDEAAGDRPADPACRSRNPAKPRSW